MELDSILLPSLCFIDLAWTVSHQASAVVSLQLSRQCATLSFLLQLSAPCGQFTFVVLVQLAPAPFVQPWCAWRCLQLVAFWYTIRTVDWEDLSRLRFLQPKFDLVQCDILHSRVVWVVSDSRWSSAKDEGLGVRDCWQVTAGTFLRSIPTVL